VGESSQLEITSVKQEGRKEISAGEFLRGSADGRGRGEIWEVRGVGGIFIADRAARVN